MRAVRPPLRRSFVETTAAAAAGTVGLLATLGSLVRALGRQSPARGVHAWFRRSLLGVAALGAAAASSLAALLTAGGVAALFRDSREERGLPYRPSRPQERVPNRLWSSFRRALNPRARPRAGDLVEVRSLPEILATLDETGCLAGLPFMPEMAFACGQRFTVLRRVDKFWEYAHGTGLRRVRNGLLLDALRCDGASHGGCQASCHLIWKDEWVKWPGAPARRDPERSAGLDLLAHTQVSTAAGVRYVCQATQMRDACDTPIRFNSLTHYGRDLLSGNLRLGAILVEVGVRAFNRLQSRLGRPTWPVLQPLNTGKTPHQELHLQPGQQVRVRSKREIEATLNQELRNRGLSFSGDLLVDCGGTYRVAASIDRVIHESTGELLTLKNPSILLEGATSLGGPLLVPQNEYFFWREIWLEPLSPPEAPAPAADS